MDSLHVCSTPQASSKTSSRSASPCRPRHHHQQQHQQQQQQDQYGASGGGGSGSIDSGKSHDGVTAPSNRSRQRSPTSRHRSPPTHRTNANSNPNPNPNPNLTPNPNSSNMDDPTTPHKGAGEHTDDGAANLTSLELPDDGEVCYSSFLSNGSSEHVQYDETDTNTVKALAAIEHLNKKIIRVRESIRMEQTMRDENVNEYLKLAANADKQQLQRIKAVFEKKNQKSAHVISQLQKKLDSYTKRLRELEAGGTGAAPHRPPREVLRDMGQGLKNVGGNIRDGITGFSGSVMSKPREFAHLIKNKFGSADNINHLSRGGTSGSGGGGSSEGGVASGPESTNNSTVVGGTSNGGDKQAHHGSATLPGGCTLTSGASASQGSVGHGAKFPSDEGSECSSVTSESLPGYGRNQEGGGQGVYSLKPIFAELQERREDYERLREKLDDYKNLQQEVQYLSSALQEERFRLERLEEQINDLTELHQNEVENLKQALADMEEKVQYQSEERLRDIHEMLEHCQTKMQKMEHQALQQQQYVTLEGIDNSNARALVVKLINVVLTVLQVVLLLVATVAGITMPFLRTRVRFLSTIFLVFAILFVLKQWPEVRDIGSHVMHHIKEMLDPVK